LDSNGVLAAIKVAVGVVAAIGTMFHLSVSDPRPVISAPEGPLFTAATALMPGRDVDRTFDVSVSGASYLGVYVTGLTSRCSQPDEASRLQLTLLSHGRPVYTGDLADFARSHSGASTALRVEPGSVDIRVRLDPAVDDRYQGCSSQADVGWVAAA
jgi:hypothetical protein